MTDEDLKSQVRKGQAILTIFALYDLNSIRPYFYDKTYHAIPEAGGDKAFELLRKAMKGKNKVDLQKQSWEQRKNCDSIPTDDGILIETMFLQTR